jgi:hypothetical protein
VDTVCLHSGEIAVYSAHARTLGSTVAKPNDHLQVTQVCSAEIFAIPPLGRTKTSGLSDITRAIQAHLNSVERQMVMLIRAADTTHHPPALAVYAAIFGRSTVALHAPTTLHTRITFDLCATLRACSAFLTLRDFWCTLTDEKLVQQQGAI